MHPSVEENDPLLIPLERAAAQLRRAERVAVLTGAGVSAESGLATFRGASGLWEGHAIEEVATPEAFARNPTLVWRFYNARRANLRTAQPNPGHHALAALEKRWGSDRFTLATQNVDGLHRSAGSHNVLELHGSLARVRCTGCARVETHTDALPDLPHCDQCGKLLRPDVVWFHEMLPEAVWRAAAQAAAQCQCFLVIGTSAVVYPAASLVDLARSVGAAIVEINLEATSASAGGAVGLYGPSGTILPRLARML